MLCAGPDDAEMAEAQASAGGAGWEPLVALRAGPPALETFRAGPPALEAFRAGPPALEAFRAGPPALEAFRTGPSTEHMHRSCADPAGDGVPSLGRPMIRGSR